MKTQVELNPIELLKEEFFARYGVSIDVQVWVQDVEKETAQQIATDFSLTRKQTISGDRLVHQNDFYHNFGFGLYVIEKGDE